MHLFDGQARSEVLRGTLIGNVPEGVEPCLWHGAILNWWHVNFLFRAVVAKKNTNMPVKVYVATIPSMEQLAQAEPISGISGHLTVIESLHEHIRDSRYVNAINRGSVRLAIVSS